MERAFIATKESDYYKALEKYFEIDETRKTFVKRFFKDKNIEADKYYFGGDGICGTPFNECNKKEINLAIIPTKNDEIAFCKMLGKPSVEGLRFFRKNYKLLKEFQQECVENEIIINNSKPDLRNYFKSLGWHALNYCHIPCDEGYYLRINSKYLKEDDIPNGMIPIKLSEFYKYQEEYEVKEGK
ncbi:MAG: hypothetical protein ACRC1T_05200 [Clostridium chrysemydis]|uniref:hypothetical protein n=1 Tax=Clostridium chrysemydis TaxID=2665504 RepID=UPI003F379CDF